jgi:streptogramin lyase
MVARKGYIGHITTDGVATEVPIAPNASMDGFTIGTDGAIWYIIFPDQTGACGRIAPSRSVKQFSTSGNAQIDGIVAAPGALWLFDSRSNLRYYRLPA